MCGACALGSQVDMAGKVGPTNGKQKEKAAPEKPKKAAPAANGSAGLLSNAYNPLSGTFHSMESGAPEAQENGGYSMFEGGPGHGDASDSDSDDERDDANGDEKRAGGAALVRFWLFKLPSQRDASHLFVSERLGAASGFCSALFRCFLLWSCCNGKALKQKLGSLARHLAPARSGTHLLSSLIGNGLTMYLTTALVMGFSCSFFWLLGMVSSMLNCSSLMRRGRVTNRFS